MLSRAFFYIGNMIKKEWSKPLIIDFINNIINSAIDPDGFPEALVQCIDGVVQPPFPIDALSPTGKSTTPTFETCS